MARTALTVVTPLGPHPGTVAANALDVVWQEADTVNGNSFVHTGRELLRIKNTDATDPATVTIASVLDPYGRLGDIEDYSLAAGEEADLWMGDATGWKQVDGLVYIDVDEAGGGNIQFLVIHPS